ncbi:MAG: XRE family transcriptional regulator, partial [Proteobacteria bacterium]|nr:XRE family transcriptional regulator [Pseudomonadota bacterium]
NENITVNLKLLRKNKGLTLEDVSNISGVSKSMLSEIERGATNPTILVLWKIAQGLKIPLTKLIEEEEKEYLVVKKDENKLMSEDEKLNIFSIFPYYEPHRSEVYKIEMAGFSKLSNDGHMNGVDEIIFVMEGKVKMVLGSSETELQKGDAIRFNGEISHGFINDHTENAMLLNFMIYEQ